MKKMILLGVFALALIATTSVGANESMKNERAEKNEMALRDGTVLTPVGGQENKDCPNGCFDNGNGCWCYEWHYYYREAN